MNKKTILSLLMLCMSIISQAQSFTEGEKVWAFENDDTYWYQATILKKEDVIHYKIHWEGFSSDYDESIHVENLWKKGLPFKVSEKLQGLETDGKWYNVKVLKHNEANNRYFIHWGGFDEKYDRWIGYDSLRLITKANAIAEGSFDYTVNSGNSSYSVNLKNKCGNKVYFYMPPVTGSGTYKHEALDGKKSKSFGYLSAGTEIWLSNEKREKISLLYTAGSSTESEVILCE